MLRTMKLSFSKLRPELFLMWLATALVLLFSVVNARLIYDDIPLQYGFSQLVANRGWFNAALSIFAADMPLEYRTYGLSKLVQFCVWSMFGSSPYVYSFLIGLSQVVTAFVLRKLLVNAGVETFTGSIVASVWMFSPFSVTGCFHHYSYLILPAQVMIFGVYSLLEFRDEKTRILISVVVGFATALTGEMHLIAAISLYLLLGWSVKSRRREFFVASVVTCIVVIVHYTLWRIFAADFSQSHRFSLDGSSVSAGLLNKASISALSIWRGLVDEVSRVIVLDNFVYVISLGLLAAFLLSIKKQWLKVPAKVVKIEIRMLSLFLFLSAMYFLFYIVTSAISGNVYRLMPRRYGFVSYSLLLCSFSFLLAILFRGGLSSKVAQSAFVMAIALVFIQLHALIIFPSVRIDRDISNKIISAVSSEQRQKTGVLFFNSSDLSIPRLKIESYTAGPRMQSSESGEIRDAIFAPYWLSQQYVVNILGFSFSGSPGPVRGDSFVNVSANPFPGAPVTVDRNGVVVVANLGFDIEDANGKGLRVFNNYSEFEPYFFKKGIDRDVVKWQVDGRNSIVVDLGAVLGSGIGVGLADKKYGDDIGHSIPWLKKYGLVSGRDGVYRNKNVNEVFGYFSTNRHGNFTYGFDFSEPGDYEVKLDFCEQWGLVPGDRYFDLEVSWDSLSWASVGVVDPARINGEKPFSIVLSRSDTKSFYFRLVQSDGSREIPLIQGVRVRKL